ncbi:MAG: polysaccharide biosynthesis protein, partial [Patescibacteria group bacterium]
MKLCITGGTGSLGSMLVERFAKSGNNITVLSRDPHKQSILRTRFPGVRFILGDIRDPNSVDRAIYFRDDSIADVVIHAAALKQVDLGEENTREFSTVNIDGSYVVADACQRAGVPNALLISSDKACVDYFTAIDVGEGHAIQIHELYKSKFCGHIKTVDTNNNNIVYSKVYNWYKSKLNGRQVF